MSHLTTRTHTSLVCLRPEPTPAVRLICIPCAGAGTSAYRAFPGDLPPGVDVWAVRLPGRESRLTEAPLADVHSIVDMLVAELADSELTSVPIALLGHSMGALICFELARGLRRRGMAEPVHLFVLGRRAPRFGDDLPSIHRLAPAEFLAEVRQLGGLPPEILTEPGLVDLVVPVLRADFEVCESYSYTAEPQLSCGITAFGGLADPTTDAAQLDGWRDETLGRFDVHRYPGDHFFLHSHRPQLLGIVARDLAVTDRVKGA